MRQVILLFVLLASAIAPASTCLDIVAMEALNPTYLSRYLLIDSINTYVPQREFIAESYTALKYTHEGTKVKIVRKHSNEEIGTEFNATLYDDESKIAGAGTENIFQTKIEGDSIISLFEQYEDGLLVERDERKFFASGALIYMKRIDYRDSTYELNKVDYFYREDTLFNVITSSYKGGDFDTAQYNFFIANSENPMECVQWRRRPAEEYFYEYVGIKIDEKPSGIVWSKTYVDGRVDQFFYIYADEQPSVVAEKIVPLAAVKKLRMRDPKGSKLQKRLPYRVVF